MYTEKYSKNALFLLFLIFFIAILSINSINATDISENITTDTNTDSEINIDNDVNNATPETSKIKSNDDTYQKSKLNKKSKSRSYLEASNILLTGFLHFSTNSSLSTISGDSSSRHALSFSSVWYFIVSQIASSLKG